MPSETSKELITPILRHACDVTILCDLSFN